MHLMFQQYLERYDRLRQSESAKRNFRRTVALFEESGLDVSTVKDFEIEEWLTGLQLSPRTRRLHKENLSAAFNYAVKRGVVQMAPTSTVKLPNEPDKEPRILDSRELRHILGNTLTREQELLITTLIYTGMRRSEVRHLMWEDISPTSIRVKCGKGGKLRHVPLHPALADVVVLQEPTSEYVFPGRDGAKSESSLFLILEKVRGNVSCTFHDFRRTVASSLYRNGVDTLVIDKILGWAPRTVGSRYYISAADDISQEAILKLYANDPIT